MNKNILIICNTPYQIFVAAWFKFSILKDVAVDIVISDQMNDSENLANNLKDISFFQNVYYVKSKALNCKTAIQKLQTVISPLRLLKKYIIINKKYDAVYASNLDAFAKLIFHSIKNCRLQKYSNRNLDFYIFEDGISTYSKQFEKQYINLKNNKQFLFVRNKNKIHSNLKGVCVFDKDAIMWEPNAPIIEIPKIDIDNLNFKNTVNSIFDYKNMSDVYKEKYIFLEESFFAEGYEINDVEVIEAIADIVGKENIMVKIHPRNPVNRFQKLGYKTNINTTIPWEVIVLNQNLGEKILLTFASSAVLNPLRLFGQNTKVYSLYKCFEKIPDILNGELWKATEYAYKKYYPTIEIIENIEESFLL